jgi:hypothetical protein
MVVPVPQLWADAGVARERASSSSPIRRIVSS